MSMASRYLEQEKLPARAWRASLALAPPSASHRRGVSALLPLRLPGAGRALVSAGHDGTLRSWDLARWPAQKFVLAKHTGWVNSVAQLGGRLLSCSNDGSVKLWGPIDTDEPATHIASLHAHRDYVTRLAVAAADTPAPVVASCGLDGTVQLWDVSRALSVCSAVSGAPVLAPALRCPDADDAGAADDTSRDVAAAAGSSSTATPEQQPRQERRQQEREREREKERGSESGAEESGSREQQPPERRRKWSLFGKSESTSQEETPGATSDEEPEDRPYMCPWVTEVEGVVQELNQTRAPGAQPPSLYSLALSESGQLVFSGSSAGKIMLWDTRDPRRVESNVLVGNVDVIRSLAYIEEQNKILSCGSDGVVRLWDIGMRWCIGEGLIHQGTVFSIVRPGRESRFLSCGKDGRVLSTNYGAQGWESTLLVHAQSPVLSMAHDQADGTLWIGTQDGTLANYEAPVRAEAAHTIKVPPRHRAESTQPAAPHGAPHVAPHGAAAGAGAASSSSSASPAPAAASSIEQAHKHGSDKELPTMKEVEMERMSRNSIELGEKAIPPLSGQERRQEIVIHDGTSHKPATVALYPTAQLKMESRGSASISRYSVLRCKTRILTQDSSGRVVLWDVMRARVAEDYGAVSFDEKESELADEVAAPSWFTVDISSGAVTLHMTYPSCFKLEMYANAAGFPAASPSKRISLAQALLCGLFPESTNTEENAYSFEVPEGLQVVLAERMWEGLGTHFAPVAYSWFYRTGDKPTQLPIPWVADCIYRGEQLRGRAMPHVMFLLAPDDPESMEFIPESNEGRSASRAPRALTVRRLCHYVTEQLNLEIPEGATPETYVEIMCKGRVLPLDMSLDSIKHCVWRSSEDMSLQYRRSSSGRASAEV
eukprot:m51a1_g307 hypothetical protein (884) ;mRNA; f:390399-394704